MIIKKIGKIKFVDESMAWWGPIAFADYSSKGPVGDGFLGTLSLEVTLGLNISSAVALSLTVS